MRIPSGRALLLALSAAVAAGCGSEPEQPQQQQYQPQPYQPQPYAGQPTYAPGAQQPPPAAPAQAPQQPAAQNPMGNLFGALGQALGQAAGQAQGQAQSQAQGGAQQGQIPWQSLAAAIPVNASGWSLAGEVKGESANVMGLAVSQASAELSQGAMKAEIQIVDTTMSPLMAMPFNVARSVRIDSSEERAGPINFGSYPGTQSWSSKEGRAQAMVMVSGRILVTIGVDNAPDEAPAIGLAQQVNYPMLEQLIGG